MKNTVFIALIILASLLTACGSINYFGIETYSPAEITFPDKVETVVIVNNAVPQPSDLGYEYILLGKMQDTTHLVTDSALTDACKVLGEAIAEQPYFKDVRLYHEPTRLDSLFFTDTKLTSSQVESICEESGADAIISIDRLLFNLKKDVYPLGEGYTVGAMEVQSTAVIRSYLPGRSNSMATVYMKDSLFWTETTPSFKLLELYLPKPEVAIRETGKYMISKAYANFVPHWIQTQRWYYTNQGARWKEASAFAASEKWEEATALWRLIYDSQKNKIYKAEAASNLALGCEMTGKLTEALDWANKSAALFKAQTSNEKDNNLKQINLYVQILIERVQADKKLNIQFGEE